MWPMGRRGEKARLGETKLGARYVQRSRWCKSKRLSPPGMWPSTGSEHEALGGPLGDVGTVEARKSRLGVDDARRSSAEEAPRLWACLASCFPSEVSPVRQTIVPEPASEVYDPQKLVLVEMLQSEPSNNELTIQGSERKRTKLSPEMCDGLVGPGESGDFRLQ